MSDEITPASLGYIGGFGPSNHNPENKGQPVETAGQTDNKSKVVDKPETKAETKTETKSQSLADILRQERAEKEAANRRNTENTSYKTKYEQLEKEFNTLKNAPSFESDPIGYVRARNMTPEEQIALGEALIYDLAPNKAPPDLRQRMYEQKREREDKARQAKEVEERNEQERQAVLRNIEVYARSLESGARSFPSGSYPESEVWFSNDNNEVDYDNYCKSLMATANNLAASASAKGQAADLTPANVARVLETEIARRLQLRDKRKSPKTETRANTEAQERIETTSSRGLNSSHKPETPSYDEYERVQRAIKAAFGS